MKLTALLVISFFIFLVGCASSEVKAERKNATSDAPLTANAKVISSNNESLGEAQFEEQDNGVKVMVEVSGLSPSKQGVHIHEGGKCEGTAGGHFNPRLKSMERIMPTVII